jgi:protein-disulfide isomerase
MYPKTFMIAVLGCGLLPAFGQSQPDYKALKEQVEALKAEVETLKKQQGAIIQQLGEVQRMAARQQGPANPVVDLKGAAETGSKTAKFAVVEFTDYWCGFCARYAKTTLPDLMKEYVATGKIRYYVKDFAAQRGPKISEAAHCAGEQGKYWPLHDKLFANYGKYSDTEVVGYAQESGADPTLFQKCVEADRYSKVVRDSMEQGVAAGIEGTPTFMIGIIDPADPARLKSVKTVVGAQSLEQFRGAIDSVIDSAK